MARTLVNAGISQMVSGANWLRRGKRWEKSEPWTPSRPRKILRANSNANDNVELLSGRRVLAAA